MARRLSLIVLLAAALHGLGMIQSTLPAQDGLTFIRVARRFQAEPWADVVRGTDRHPLYPALVALVQPALELVAGSGPHSWRLAAQAVSVLAAIGLLLPLYALTRSLFGASTAALAALLFVLLPLPAEIGHETLSDALALLLTALALATGEKALRTGRPGPALACGIASGLGYLTRPEVAIVPVAVTVAAAWPRILAALGFIAECLGGAKANPIDAIKPRRGPYASPVLASTLAFLTLVGGYAMIKGEVSEKLAVRVGAALPGRAGEGREAPSRLPAGLDDPRWDFSPKEESDAEPPSPLGPALGRVLNRWAEGLGWGLAPFVVLGIWSRRASGPGRRLAGAYALLFGAALVRHVTTLGYLSGRHTLPIVLVSLPWAAAGVQESCRRFAEFRGLDEAGRHRRRVVALAMAIGLAAFVQARPTHAARWGHRAAGLWLAEHAGPADAVLDTRGWATFVSGRPGYDPWHVGQALSDARLAYIVVGADELAASSRRAETLRAVLAYAATPAAEFPARAGGDEVGVRVFRFRRPATWEGLRP